MSDILETIAAYARERVEKAKETLPYEELYARARALPVGHFPFEAVLRVPGMSYICECKKASPSKGLIAPDFPYVEIARDYERAGASCLSVLTEPKWFLGDDAYLREIAQAVSLPCLRKDFTIDPYMICQAKVLGASAVLLIVSLLDEGTLAQYMALAEELGLSALVECHDESEVRTALSAGARIIGVNNRNLRDFSVDAGNCLRLRSAIPEDVVFVAESGIKSHEDIVLLENAHVNAVLIGESMMRSADKTAFLRALKGI